MNRALIKKCLTESQWLLVFCAAAMYAFCWLRVWTIGLLDMGQLSIIVEQFREYERFFPVPVEQLLTYAGRVAVVYDEPVVVVSMSVWAIARGTDAISGELGRGTMEMLLAQPVRRLHVLLTQAAVTVLGAGLLALAAWLGTWTGVATTTVTETIVAPPVMLPGLGISIPSPLNEAKQQFPLADKVAASDFLPAAANLFCLGFFLAGLSTLMSSWDQYRGRTIGIVMGIYIVQVIIKIVGMADEDLEWMQRFSFMTAYDPERFVSNAVNQPQATWAFALRDAAGHVTELGASGNFAILIGLGTIAYAAAAAIFCRRDLPAPL